MLNLLFFCKEIKTPERRLPVRQYLFLEQNSLYFHQKPHKATALLHFWLQYRKFSVLTKLRSTLKYKFRIQEKEKIPDNADAHREFLSHYCAKS